MKTTMPKLRRTIQRVIQESMAQQDIIYLENLLRSYPGTFRDWSEFCVWYDDLMMELRLDHDEEMDAFLMINELEFCPASIEDLLSILNDTKVQRFPMFSMWASALRRNF